MPFMGGDEAIKIIRKIEQLANRSPTPILVCARDSHNLDHYLSEGFDAVLAKVGFHCRVIGSLLIQVKYWRKCKNTKTPLFQN